MDALDMADKESLASGPGRLRATDTMKVRTGSARWPMLPSAPDWEFDIDKFINQFVPHSQLYRLPRPLSHWLGYRGEPEEEVGNILVSFWAWVGAFCGLIVCTAVFRFSKDVAALHPPVVFASLGATAILDYNTIRSPLAQPRAAIMGHTIAVVTGVGLSKLFMLHSDYESIRWIAGPFVCGAASAVMTMTNTVHPPGGATSLLAAVDPTVIAMGWWFVPAIILGSLLMLLVALLVNNIQRQYPVFWWTGKAVGRRKAGDIESLSTRCRSSSRSRSPKRSTRRSTSEKRRHASHGLAVSGLQDVIALNEDFVVLPEGFVLGEEEVMALRSLQTHLVTWTRQDEKADSTSCDETQVEDEPLQIIRMPTWSTRNAGDPDTATYRGGSAIS